MKYVFGPVPSRRLGRSLGIDPVPLKTCNWNCVYCQLGRTKLLINERKEYIVPSDILFQVQESLSVHKPGEIDWVTFIGSGETCLHESLGFMIREVKKMTALPVAVITNGSLLYLPEVRAELMAADTVMPSFDAGNPDLYRKINRPYPSLTFKRLVNGLLAFRKEYSGKMWIEVMLMKGINDSEAALKEIATFLDRFQPDEVHILQPTRPPVELWVYPPDKEGLQLAQEILGKSAKIILPAVGSFDLDKNGDMVDEIVNIITRHPMREAELIETLTHWYSGEVREILVELAKSGKAQKVLRNGVHFWSAAPSFYPETTKSSGGVPPLINPSGKDDK